ncbi:MAG: M42 family metallopeptidase [Bacilli bacterium]|nr:M42 family metallopeptidase [Bacilli bacterium]MDD4076889.1 M42 family metallopeptidase [Bacilli bacterium]MDD4387873.1 M42 family metallopeptidase [Bacilli bacterium]
MKVRKRMKIYEDLVNLDGISGHETSVRNYLYREIEKSSDRIIKDKLGSVFGVALGAEQPIIMIAGHMDEVGAMVSAITEKGFIKMIAIGGINPEIMVSQNVAVTIRNNKKIKGVVGAIPPHITRGDDKSPDFSFDNLLLDIGADSREHAQQMGIEIGQMITFENNYYITEDGKKIVSKAWDNRFGCGMAVEILKEVSQISHPNTVIAGATVQEEVGLRGAYTATQTVKPDLFIAVDVSPVGDFLDKNHPRAYGKLGGGFLIRFYDPRTLMNPLIKQYFENLAFRNNIPFQQFLSMGGTDAGAAQYAGNGVLATTIGLPGRYIHSSASMIHIDDVEAVRKMLLAIIKDFDRQKLEELKNA